MQYDIFHIEIRNYNYGFQVFMQATCSGFPNVAEQVVGKEQCTILILLQ
jgi:hypothetical protein